MKNLNKHQIIAIGSSIAALYAVLCLVAFASAASRTEKPAAVDAEQFADFMGYEVLDIQDLAEGAEVQRRMFNRITPPGLSWTQPMFPPVAPFDAQYFDGQFLEGLLGEDKNSVAIYPLSLIQDPQTRETLIYNAEGELIAAIPADGVSREWPTDADPSRVILQLDLLPAEDVEPYLYTERRIEETLARHNAPRSAKSGGAATRGLEAGEFGICDIQGTTNGTMFITVTNGANVAEVFAYTVWHTSSVVVVTWTNEQSNVVTDTNTVWHQVSPAFNGLESAWECLATNLVLTNGVGIYEDANISSNARIRFYAVANRQDTDGDGLTDGAESFIYHTNPGTNDTDGDAMLDGWEVFHGLNPLADDSLDDPDQDGLPNVYEQFSGTNPTNSDAASAAVLRVDPSGTGANVYPHLRAAFTSSVPYSIIEVADGVYSGVNNTHLWFPAHPVMLCSDSGGSSRKTAFLYDGEGAAFYFDAQQNNHTIVKGISLCLNGKGSYQYGFWLGPGVYFGEAGAAPIFDGVSVETGASGNNIAFMCYGSATDPIVFNNCVFRGKPGKSVPVRGIYAMDSSVLQIINCTFLDFPASPYAYGVQLHSRYLAETGVVEIANCIWDSSFTASNPTPPFVTYCQFSNSAPYVVQVADSIMPAMPTWFLPDAQTNLYITNALVAMGGHLRPLSPGINIGGATLTLTDFEGHPRDAAPDIGADEYAALGEGDSDGDGLSDALEINTYGTDPYCPDSDGDNIPDGTEVADGTDPTNPWSYRFDVQASVTNQTGNSSLVWLCHRWGAGAWNTNTAVMVTNEWMVLEILASNQSNTLFVGAFCDYNTNGLPDAVEPIYWKEIVATGSLVRTSFLLKDFDGDCLDDWQEILCGTDPFSSNDYCFSVSGNLTNLLHLETYHICVGISASTNASEMFVVTNVSADGSFSFPHIHMTNYMKSFYPIHFDDVNTNGLWDSGELYGLQHPFASSNRTGHDHQITLYSRDKDFDDMPDFWEARHNLCWTNRADCTEDPDGDGIYNVLEYQANLNPWVANGSGNTAIRDAVNAVDAKLTGLTPSVALPIFSVADYTTTNYVRNTNCWAYSYDLTCCSPWNSYRENEVAGTLISPQHLIFAGHFMPPTNVIFRFVDRQNRTYERRLVAIKRHPDYSPYPTNYPDIAVGKLDSAITNGISFAKVLPESYTNYLSSGIRLPTLRLDKEEKALVGDLFSINHSVGGNHFTSFMTPLDATRLSFYEGLIPGDSGNPVFLLLSGQPILLTIWTGGGAGTGTSLVAFTNDINQLMSDLGGGYQLTTFDMPPEFSEITQ